MKIDQKIISKSLLGFIGVQVLFVGVGLSRHYLFPQEEQVIKKAETIGFYRNEILYGAICNNPIQYPVGPIGNKARDFKIYTIGTTTGTSGDSAVIEISV